MLYNFANTSPGQAGVQVEKVDCKLENDNDIERPAQTSEHAQMQQSSPKYMQQLSVYRNIII